MVCPLTIERMIIGSAHCELKDVGFGDVSNRQLFLVIVVSVLEVVVRFPNHRNERLLEFRFDKVSPTVCERLAEMLCRVDEELVG